MTERDERLGAAVRELSVPPHADDFWNELDRTIAVDTRHRRSPRASTMLRVAALAALALVVVATATMVIRRPDPTTTGVTAGDRSVPPMVTGTIVSHVDDGQAVHDDEQRFAVAVDGSVSMDSSHGAGDIAFDAPARRLVIKQPEGSGTGGIGWFIDSNAEPQWTSILSVGAVEAAVAEANGTTGTGTTFLGRPAIRYERTGELEAMTGRPVNRTITVVDADTKLLLQRVDELDGKTVSNFEVTEFVVHDRIDRSRFELRPPPDARVLDDLDLGNRTVALEELQSTVGYTVDAPDRVLGRALTDVVARPGAAPQQGRTTPIEHDRSMLVYRNGYDAVEVTIRRTSATDAPDTDPIGPGTSSPPPQIVPDPAGDIRVVVEAGRRVPHAWATRGPFVVAASGALDGDDLVEVIRAITPHQ